MGRDPVMLWLHRFRAVPVACVAGSLYWTGGFTMMAIGYCLGLVILSHLSGAVNYLCHKVGERRIDARDRSTNLFLLNVMTMGEGLHHNHHVHPGAASNRTAPGDLDPTFAVLRALAAVGRLWDLQTTTVSTRRASASP